MKQAQNTLYLLSLRISALQLSSPLRSYASRFAKIPYPWINRRKPYWVQEKANPISDQDLTDKNAAFTRQVRIEAMRERFENTQSPLLEAPWIRQNVWTSDTQRCGLIGIKLGVYPQWTKEGKRVDCTIVQIPDNHVIRWIPPEETDKVLSLRDMRPYMIQREMYPAWITQRRWGIQLVGAVSCDPLEFTPAWAGLFKEAGVPVKRKICRFFVSPDAALQPGTELHMEHFRVGDYIDYTARTVNRGFQGVMERWAMEGGPGGHGSTKFHRKMGSAAGAGRKILRAKRMPGVMGNRYRSNRSVQIVRINTRYKLFYLRGTTPGPVNSFCQLHDPWMANRRRELAESPPVMPTFYPEDAEDVNSPEDIYHESIHPYDSPSITYELPAEPKSVRRK